jgi:hypothetical protein
VVEEINLRVHIAALRRALGDGEKGQRYIVNVPQCGYSFIAPVHGDSVAQVVFDTLQAPQQNLPARLTPVIGRDSLVGRLVRQMPLCRLMTLTGPAGIGKPPWRCGWPNCCCSITATASGTSTCPCSVMRRHCLNICCAPWTFVRYVSVAACLAAAG